MLYLLVDNFNQENQLILTVFETFGTLRRNCAIRWKGNDRIDGCIIIT